MSTVNDTAIAINLIGSPHRDAVPQGLNDGTGSVKKTRTAAIVCGILGAVLLVVIGVIWHLSRRRLILAKQWKLPEIEAEAVKVIVKDKGEDDSINSDVKGLIGGMKAKAGMLIIPSKPAVMDETGAFASPVERRSQRSPGQVRLMRKELERITGRGLPEA